MKTFFNDCNKIELVLFVLMTVQTVQSVVQSQWTWVVLLGLLALVNGWNMLPPYTQAAILAWFKR